MKKTVLITGCSSGFGKTAAKYFGQKGWNVIATMRNTRDGEDLKNLSNVLVTRLDVQDTRSIEDAIAEGIRHFGGIDVLINNAGYGLFGIFETTSPEKIKQQFEVNVFGVMETTRAILPHFRSKQDGVIMNISSGAGVATLPMLSLYCSSKFALEGFSEALSYELLSQNIRVKIIEPGGVISTNFGNRSATEAAQNHLIPDYDKFTKFTNEVFNGLRKSRLAAEEDVVRVMFEAANDETDRLRYVATEDIRPLVQKRRESNEEEYISYLRSNFMMPR